MHEWALAESILITAEKAAKQEKLDSISEIKIKLGELQQIDKDVFRNALKKIITEKNTISDNTNIIIEDNEAFLKCLNCGTEWRVKEQLDRIGPKESESIHFIPELAHTYVKCPFCGSADFEILQGRGIWIDYISG